ncbi:MAG: TldD/PmbA family protein [Sphingomonadales bacterium]
MPDNPKTALDLLANVLEKACAAGADAADAVMFDNASLSVSYRMGRLEDVERSESKDLGLRAFFGKQQAVVSTTDVSAEALDALIERAVAMARAAPEDPNCGLAPEELLITGDAPELDMFDGGEPDTETLTERAKAAEDAARAVKGVTNSQGAGASWSRHGVALAATNGLARGYSTSSHSVGVQVIAGDGAGMEADHDHCAARHAEDLDDPAAIGRSAGERAVKRLNPRKVATCQAPVVFDPRVSNGLLGHFSGAINGRAIARGTSFLKDAMGDPVFAPGVTVTDDPLRVRGVRSKPFDAEGLATRRSNLIEDGRLTSWVLDSATARQLGLTSTGHASRGISAPPSPSATNLFLAPGPVTPHELIEDIDRGFYVTGLIGMGVNPVTGDYSRGANGFWIENGEIAFPVSELTIAGNLRDMFRHLIPASDLEFRYGVNCPTVRIEGMTVAGS